MDLVACVSVSVCVCISFWAKTVRTLSKHQLPVCARQEEDG